MRNRTSRYLNLIHGLFEKLNKNVAAALIIAIPCLCSCEKDSTLLYGASVIGFYENSCITTDNGQIFHITETSCDTSELEASSRIFAICDILSSKGSKEYYARMHDFSKVLCKDAVHSDSGDMGHEPIEIAAGWISKGYINILAGVPVTPTSSEAHFINLYVPSGQEKADTLNAYFRHNGHMDTSPSPEGESYSIFRAYASFPLASILPSESGNTILRIHWSWYEEPTGNPDDVLKNMTTCIRFSH